MDRERCFQIEGKDLFLEKVLVDFEKIPIFYLCRDEQEYYVVLCIDIEALEYIIIKPKLMEILDVLNGKIQMREIFENQKNYWQVFSGESIEEDEVFFHKIEELDKAVLPYENAYFEVLTNDIQNYIDYLMEKIFDKNAFKIIASNAKNDFNELEGLDFIFNGGFTEYKMELSSERIKMQISSSVSLKNEISDVFCNLSKVDISLNDDEEVLIYEKEMKNASFAA